MLYEFSSHATSLYLRMTNVTEHQCNGIMTARKHHVYLWNSLQKLYGSKCKSAALSRLSSVEICYLNFGRLRTLAVTVLVMSGFTSVCRTNSLCFNIYRGSGYTLWQISQLSAARRQGFLQPRVFASEQMFVQLQVKRHESFINALAVIRRPWNLHLQMSGCHYIRPGFPN